MIHKDQLNRSIFLKEIPKRIICLVPSQTELLVDLGLFDSIVGVTKFCVHPQSLKKEKTIIGGTKNIKLDKIKALKPDIILCNKEENSIEIIESLKGVAPIHISDIYTIKNCYELIEMYATIFDVIPKGKALINAIEHERNTIKIKTSNSKKAVYFIWKDPWMVAASNTFIDVMLHEAGFVNVFKNEKRYPEISLDNLCLARADVLLLPSEPFPFAQKHCDALQLRFPDKDIIIIDGELFSWYGSRLLKSYHYFKTLKTKKADM